MIKPILLTLLLSACSTTVQVHESLDCLGLPKHGVTFTDAEIDTITDSVFNKFEKVSISYKQRIKSICKTIEIHNKLHKVK